MMRSRVRVNFTLPLSHLHRHATDLQERKAGDKRQRVQMERRSHRPVRGWWGTGVRSVHREGVMGCLLSAGISRAHEVSSFAPLSSETPLN
jgi:hypothetical protein